MLLEQYFLIQMLMILTLINSYHYAEINIQILALLWKIVFNLCTTKLSDMHTLVMSESV